MGCTPRRLCSELASHANKGPDWKGSVPAMKNGWYYDADGVRTRVHNMQFQAEDKLARDITSRPGLIPTQPHPTDWLLELEGHTTPRDLLSEWDWGAP